MVRPNLLFRVRPVWIAILLMTILALAGCTSVEQMVAGPTITPPPPGPTWLDPPGEVPAFTLIDQHGQPFTRNDLAGRPALFYFGYTFCPDVCPLTLAEIRQVIGLLEADAQDVNFVFVSVDFRRDTPARLSQYLPAFDARLIGLTTNDEAHVRSITQGFGVFYELEESSATSAEYLVAHTSATFLVDRDGRIRVKFAYRTPPPEIAEVIRQILQEPGAEALDS